MKVRWKALTGLSISCLVLLLAIYLNLIELGTVSFILPAKNRNSTSYRGQHRGAVASEARVCTQTGLDILQKGGNAADAMIATVFCLGTVAMYHTGPGGGGFALVRSPDGRMETIDFKERAPAAAFEDMFVGNVDASLVGGLASAVPGELRGLEYLHENYASMPWAELIEPSIILARDGFRVDEDLYMFMTMEDNPFLRHDPSWAMDFAPDGKLKQIGETITRRRFADTLEKISKHGADSFYSGDIAAATIRAVQKANGTLTLDDFRNYQAKGTTPIQITYRDYIITSDSLPGGGTQALSMMKTMEGYSDMGHLEALNLSTHRLIEAMRFSFAERTGLGDPDYNKAIRPFAEWMISDEAARERRNKILDAHTLPQNAYGPLSRKVPKTGGTAAMITTDSSGLVITLTSTVNGFWGSHVCVPETGVIMNNIMSDFSTPDSPSDSGLPSSSVNYPQPRKRPCDSIANIIVTHRENSSFHFATCTAGGNHILTTDIAMLRYVLDMKMSATEAINQPRLHGQLHPNYVELDWTWNNGTIAFLKGLAHNVTLIEPGFSINQAVLRRWDGSFDAATEPNLNNSYAGTV